MTNKELVKAARGCASGEAASKQDWVDCNCPFEIDGDACINHLLFTLADALERAEEKQKS